MNELANIYDLKESNGKPKKYRKNLLDDLPALNKKRKIKIRAQVLANNVHSLYLDIFHNKRRERKFLKLYIQGKSSTREKDINNLNLALKLRDKYELELFQNEHGFKMKNHLADIDFVQFFYQIKEKQKKKNSRKPYTNAYNYLKSFTNDKLAFSEVDKKFCNDFKEYLLNNVAANTAHTYFSRLKAVLNVAVEKEIIDTNPARFIQIKKTDVEREFLTIEELRKLKDTPCPNEQTKRAFLFSCFTGLRFSDIQKLTFNDVREGYLYFRQEKTSDVERVPLSKSALGILDQQRAEGRTEGKVFNLNIHDATRKQINKWVEKAELKKHVTWHVGRHTFATMALTHDIDIYTLRDLLGHKDLKNTQIYAKLIDKKKAEAIDKLPEL
jgi:integrase